MAANVLGSIPDDLVANSLLEELLLKERTQEALTAPFFRRQMNEGNIVLGADLFERFPHLQFAQEFGNNSLTAGIPGCGKSTQIKLLAPQMAAHGIKVFSIDSEKEELRNLERVLGRMGEKLHVINGREFRINPLQPDCDPHDYIEHISLSIGTSLDVLEAGVRLLREEIYKLYLERGVFEGSNNFPTLFDLRESVVINNTGNAKTKEAILARLDPVLINTPGLRFRVGENSEALSKHNVVLECGGLSPEARDLIVGSIITKEFLRRKAKHYVNAPLDWWLCIDDAQRICANPDGQIARWINVIRSTGMAFHFCVQSPQIAPAILANTPTKFCGILASAEDSYFMARSMGLLSYDQSRWIATNLQRGQFLCQLSNGWRHPFLLEVRPIEFMDEPGVFERPAAPQEIIHGYLQ